jgi:hypothetical protein
MFFTFCLIPNSNAMKRLSKYMTATTPDNPPELEMNVGDYEQLHKQSFVFKTTFSLQGRTADCFGQPSRKISDMKNGFCIWRQSIQCHALTEQDGDFTVSR